MIKKSRRVAPAGTGTAVSPAPVICFVQVGVFLLFLVLFQLLVNYSGME